MVLPVLSKGQALLTLPGILNLSYWAFFGGVSFDFYPIQLSNTMQVDFGTYHHSNHQYSNYSLIYNLLLIYSHLPLKGSFTVDQTTRWWVYNI
jgi:hypothetical protein